ncbi:MAG: hypothetical protein ABIM89_19370, partial [Mycobacteriales bacterium]
PLPAVPTLAGMPAASAGLAMPATTAVPVTPPMEANFGQRRSGRTVLYGVFLVAFAPTLVGPSSPPGARLVWWAVELLFAGLIAERVSRALRLREGRLLVRKGFRTRRVDLPMLIDLRAELTGDRDWDDRGGRRASRNEQTRYRLADEAGRQVSLFIKDVAHSAELTQALVAWARYRGLELDNQTEALLFFEGTLGGFRGLLLRLGKAIWEAFEQSRRT